MFEGVSKVKVLSSACGAFQAVNQTSPEADSMRIGAKRLARRQGAEATFDGTCLDCEGHERVKTNA
jgi:hypothetical protein